RRGAPPPPTSGPPQARRKTAGPTGRAGSPPAATRPARRRPTAQAGGGRSIAPGSSPVVRWRPRHGPRPPAPRQRDPPSTRPPGGVDNGEHPLRRSATLAFGGPASGGWG